MVLAKPRVLSATIQQLCGRGVPPALQFVRGAGLFLVGEDSDYHFNMRRLVAHLPVFDQTMLVNSNALIKENK